MHFFNIFMLYLFHVLLASITAIAADKWDLTLDSTDKLLQHST